MRLIVSGDRHWYDEGMIHNLLLKHLKEIEVVIHGAARGADTMAGKVAHDLGIPVVEFPADWTTYGKGAGPIRNKAMITEGEGEMVWAFHDFIAQSKGTKNMILLAKRYDVPVRLFSHQGEEDGWKRVVVCRDVC